MPFSNLDIKRIYYYVICAMAFFVLMWGTVDLVSSSIGLIRLPSSRSIGADETGGSSSLSFEKGDQYFDSYYQSKMLSDRLWDSLARVLVGGMIFAYCRKTVEKMEKQA